MCKSEVNEHPGLGLAVFASNDVLILAIYVPQECLTEVVVIGMVVDSEAMALTKVLLLTLSDNL